MAAVLFWLLAAGSVLGVLGSAGVSGSSEVQGASGVQGDYQLLQDTHKKGVDLAADRLNAHAGISHHFRYFRTVSQSDIQPGFDVSYIYHHFYLKATACPRGTVDTSDCPFRNDRPLFDCATCYKTFAGEIEASPKPYVHCIHKPALTKDMKTARTKHCNNMGYSSGAPTLLASTGEEE